MSVVAWKEKKIDTLNHALRSMLVSFAKESRLNAEIQVALVTFGEVVLLHMFH